MVTGGNELRKVCKDEIAHFKIPKNYKFMDAFPMTVTGKVQKFKMRGLSSPHRLWDSQPKRNLERASLLHSDIA